MPEGDGLGEPAGLVALGDGRGVALRMGVLVGTGAGVTRWVDGAGLGV